MAFRISVSMIKSYLKIKNKKQIMNYIDEIPFDEHQLVGNGVSTYEYTIQDFDIPFKQITDKFLSMVGPAYNIIDFWINKYFYIVSNSCGYIFAYAPGVFSP